MTLPLDSDLEVKTLAMKSSSLLLALAGLAAAAPSSHAKRQITSVPLGMVGILGIDTTFDYVVVGGGTAGLTIATRLAESPGVTVAVIEAGSFYELGDPIFSTSPGGDTTFIGTSETMPTVDWGFFTQPDPASGNKKRSYARGKCLGGRYAFAFISLFVYLSIYISIQLYSFLLSLYKCAS